MTDMQDANPAAAAAAGDTAKISSADFLKVLRREQSAFRTYGFLFALLIVAVAVLLAFSGYITFQRLNEISKNNQLLLTQLETTRLENTGLVVDLSFSKRAEESRNEGQVKLNQEANDTRRLLAFSDPSVQLPAGFLRRTAVEAAKSHITETPFYIVQGDPNSQLNGRLNWATAGMVVKALEACDTEDLTCPLGANPLTDGILSADERTLLQAALTGWQGDASEAGPLFRRLADSTSSPFRAYGYVGLSELAEARSSRAGAVSLGWASGCGEAVEYVNRALDAGLPTDTASAYLTQGACLRKDGQTLPAFRAFQSALASVAPEGLEGEPVYPASSQHLYAAFHGVGTTIIALVNLDAVPDDLDLPMDPSLYGQEMLERAAEYRALWGMSRVGQMYSLENVAFALLQRDALDEVITHTTMVDKTLSLAWNLTARFAAAAELARRADDDEGRGRYMLIADEALLKLSQFDEIYFDIDELRRMAPPAFAPYVDVALETARQGADYVLSKAYLSELPAPEGADEETPAS